MTGAANGRLSHTACVVLGGTLVAAAIALSLLFMGPPVIALCGGLVVAFVAWLVFSSRTPGPDSRVTVVYWLAVVVQVLHVVEEYAAGFQRQFPAIWGFEWSGRQFLVFNLAWLAVFVIAGFGLVAGERLAFLAAWFMAILGGVGNGVFHPALSLRTGGYFPGSVTALLHFVIGVFLIAALVRRRPRRAD